MHRIKIKASKVEYLPKYQTDGSAGMDLHADINFPLVIKTMHRALVPTGILIELPIGFEAQIRPRSGLALKHGITIPNSPATIDSDYRGEYQVILQNLGDSDFTVQPGDRIAQLVISKYERVEWEVVEEIETTQRGAGGFGSTGK